MRYDLIHMLPEDAFQPDPCGRMRLHGGGGKGGGSAPPPAPAQPEKQVVKEARVDELKANNKNKVSGGMGPSSNNTMLTGPSGVEQGSQSLGKSTLLGS